MTNKQKMFLVMESYQYEGIDAYVSDMALSSIWGEAGGTCQIPEIKNVFMMCNRSIRDISSAAGISNRQLAERFCIPYRTVEDWSSGKSKPPIYVLLMMQELLLP